MIYNIMFHTPAASALWKLNIKKRSCFLLQFGSSFRKETLNEYHNMGTEWRTGERDILCKKLNLVKSNFFMDVILGHRFPNFLHRIKKQITPILRNIKLLQQGFQCWGGELFSKLCSHQSKWRRCFSKRWRCFHFSNLEAKAMFLEKLDPHLFQAKLLVHFFAWKMFYF